MTKECLEILNRGGKCTEEECEFLECELPSMNSTDYGSDTGFIGYRHYTRYYLHEVRGYCVIYGKYTMYEDEFYFPEFEDRKEYLAQKDLEEEGRMIFFNLAMDKKFSTYKELKEYFEKSGGYAASDPRNDPDLFKLIVSSDDYLEEYHDCYYALFEHMNYIEWSNHAENYMAVIWFNSNEYCTMDACYVWDELGRKRPICASSGNIRYYLNGVLQHIQYGVDDPDLVPDIPDCELPW